MQPHQHQQYHGPGDTPAPRSPAPTVQPPQPKPQLCTDNLARINTSANDNNTDEIIVPNISSVRGLRERAPEKPCINMTEMRAVDEGNMVEDYDGMPKLVKPVDDEEGEDETDEEGEDETVRQKMLSRGIKYDRKGYACAP